MSDFKPEWIWGDDAETTVFAQGYGNDRTIIFSFSLNPSKASTSLANRICAYMHGLEVNDESHSFADATAMSEAVWEAVRRFWPACSADPRAQRPDVVFAIDPDADETSRDETPWHAYQHPLFQRYVGYLADDKSTGPPLPSPPCPSTSISRLLFPGFHRTQLTKSKSERPPCFRVTNKSTSIP